MATIEELAAKYGGGGSEKPTAVDATDIDALAAKYGGDAKPSSVATSPSSNNSVWRDINRGFQDVSDTLDVVLQPTVGKLLGLSDTSEKRKAKLQEYEQTNDKNNLGRVGGQLLATAPLLPMRAIQATRAAFGSLPITLSTGEKIAAPLINRLGAASATGALGGAAFGLGTSGVSENPAAHVGENILGGVVGGPVLERAGALAGKVLPTIKNVINKAKINYTSNKFGINPQAAKQALEELNNEGMTLAEAEAQLIKLGDSGTMADLTPALQTLAGALAQRGGRTTAILKNRFANRAETADSSAHNLMITKLGPKPDLEVEVEAIKKEARRLAGPDYDLAHTSNDKLPITGLVSHIDAELENAVGSRASILKEIKGYLYKPDKSPKDSVSSLHSVREEIDDILNKRGDGLSPNTFGKVTTVRNALDTILKTNTNMAKADAVFAEKMTIKNGLDFGNKSLNKGNFESFEKVFNTASPELQGTIRKGMHAQIGDLMELAARGELAGAQQLFGRKSANRKKLELAFGTRGTEVLDALSNEAAKRSTENMIATGSRTSVNNRINALFDSERPRGIMADALTGVAMDATTGSLGTGTAIMAAKRTGGNILTRFGEKRKDAFAEGTADLLSRSGSELKTTFGALNKINVLQNRVSVNKSPKMLSLPVNMSAVIGTSANDYLYSRVKDNLKY